MINPAGLDLITRFEDFKPKPYDDGTGTITIGYGHTRSAVMPAQVTEEEALELLRSDLDHFIQAVANEVRVPINENQFAALVSLAFNIGDRAFANSTLLKKLNSGNYVAASNEFQKWNKVTVNGQKQRSVGLSRRRAAEEQLFRTPPQQTVDIQVHGLHDTIEALSDADKLQALAGAAFIWVVPQTALLVPEGDDDGADGSVA